MQDVTIVGLADRVHAFHAAALFMYSIDPHVNHRGAWIGREVIGYREFDLLERYGYFESSDGLVRPTERAYRALLIDRSIPVLRDIAHDPYAVHAIEDPSVMLEEGWLSRRADGYALTEEGLDVLLEAMEMYEAGPEGFEPST